MSSIISERIPGNIVNGAASTFKSHECRCRNSGFWSVVGLMAALHVCYFVKRSRIRVSVMDKYDELHSIARSTFHFLVRNDVVPSNFVLRTQNVK